MGSEWDEVHGKWVLGGSGGMTVWWEERLGDGSAVGGRSRLWGAGTGWGVVERAEVERNTL